MDLANILLWTFSLVLGVIGILFGFIASINATKANNQIKNLISSSWINDESEKFFFDNMKSVVAANRKVITLLKNNDTTYHKYSITASLGRFVPISTRVLTFLSDTEFKSISILYKEMKEKYDVDFQKIIKEFKILSSDEVIKPSVSKNLLKYHESLLKDASEIMKKYNEIISLTSEISFKD